MAPGSILSGPTLGRVIAEAATPYLLLLPGGPPLSMEADAPDCLIAAAQGPHVGMVYGDYREKADTGGEVLHRVCDYQPGSVRDDFDFGAIMLFPASVLREVADVHGAPPEVAFAGLYDLRLKVSEGRRLVRLPQALCTLAATTYNAPAGRLFAYLDTRNEPAQREMEGVFTDHLRRIGAHVPAGRLKGFEDASNGYPVEASVVIPVKNRRATIRDAVESALSQETDFPFNVIVVDNHSTDGTTDVLRGMAARAGALMHIVPARDDLAIGGCWNEAACSPACGRYAVQLDSDDLYRDAHALKRVVDMLRRGYAMVVGSYTLVDFTLAEIPPGLIDHREWTDGNGHNNALRVNGLGAPRAFATSVLRQTGFPNVSYGEDYAVALRICREYRVGRIYESLYLCRRWTDNTDAGLDTETTNRNNAFKDGLRTAEILARQQMLRKE
jgi:hypothetical protein